MYFVNCCVASTEELTECGKHTKSDFLNKSNARYENPKL